MHGKRANALTFTCISRFLSGGSPWFLYVSLAACLTVMSTCVVFAITNQLLGICGMGLVTSRCMTVTHTTSTNWNVLDAVEILQENVMRKYKSWVGYVGYWDHRDIWDAWDLWVSLRQLKLLSPLRLPRPLRHLRRDKKILSFHITRLTHAKNPQLKKFSETFGVKRLLEQFQPRFSTNCKSS